MSTKKILIQVPYVPSTWHKIEVMLELAQTKPGEKMADLGSGDGRIIMAFAERGVESHGFEINPDLALLAESKILDANLDERAFIHITDFWKVDLSSFNTVVIYGMTSIMNELELKLKKELKPGSKVLSAIFHFPEWKPTAQKDNVLLYII
jgi:cyclopropane fatty-acyl-phospholipid synthase-like methyltransferase